MERCIITVVGHDRPGILANVSEALLMQECNIENVSQTILQSEFAGIFIVSRPANLSTGALAQLLNKRLAGEDLEVYVKSLEQKSPETQPLETSPFIITTSGPDQKGLVSGITRVMADHGVNITYLKAVFKGTKAPRDYVMIYSVDVPENTSTQDLMADLRSRAQELGLNISIQHRNIFDTVNRI